MSDTSGGPAIPWQQLREFAGVDLSRSFVLSWSIEHGTLMIDVDLFLLPEHAFYEEPRPAEKVCIRPATVEFPYVQAIGVNGDAGVSDLRAIVERLELGRIRDLCRKNDGPFEIEGDFGTVLIDAERPILRLRAL